MIGASTPEGLAARFTAIAHTWVGDGPAERAERARRKLLAASPSAPIDPNKPRPSRADAEQAVKTLLAYIGEDSTREGHSMTTTPF